MPVCKINCVGEGGRLASRSSRGDVGSLDLFFFFQAEDGIRDLTVTGVQTCALPILRFSGGVARDTVPMRTPKPVPAVPMPARKPATSSPPGKAFENTISSSPAAYTDRKSVV